MYFQEVQRNWAVRLLFQEQHPKAHRSLEDQNATLLYLSQSQQSCLQFQLPEISAMKCCHGNYVQLPEGVSTSL